MRILDLTAIYPHPAADFEGRSVALLDRALARAGASVTTLVLKPWVPGWLAARRPGWRHLDLRGGLDRDRSVRAVIARYPHLPTIARLPAPRRLAINTRTMARRALRAHRRLAVDADLVHAQGITLGLVAAAVARRLATPFAVTLRDDLGHLDAERLPPPYQELFSTAAAIFAIGPKQMRDAPCFLPSHRRSALVLAPNGVDFEAIEEILKAAPPRPAGPTCEIVSVANLYRWKGIHENLEALAQINRRGFTRWRYNVVGDGPYRAELAALAARLGLTDQVRFFGRLPHEEAVLSIHRANLFCLPSWMESFGNVFAEAAVCGVPAIGCKGQGPELIIRHGETGVLVPPRNVGALADALFALLTRPERARAMGDAARRLIRRFTWERTAAMYMDRFSQVLAAQSPAP